MLQNFPSYYELIETMRVEHGEIFSLDYHLSRLERSAHRFSFPISIEEVKKELIDYVSRVNDDLYRLRLLLNPNGLIKITHEKHIGNTRIRLGLAKEPIDNRNVFLYHKITCREIYAQRKQQSPECEDVLLWNVDGYISESTIANVVVQFGDKKYTPLCVANYCPALFAKTC